MAQPRRVLQPCLLFLFLVLTTFSRKCLCDVTEDLIASASVSQDVEEHEEDYSESFISDVVGSNTDLKFKGLGDVAAGNSSGPTLDINDIMQRLMAGGGGGQPQADKKEDTVASDFVKHVVAGNFGGGECIHEGIEDEDISGLNYTEILLKFGELQLGLIEGDEMYYGNTPKTVLKEKVRELQEYMTEKVEDSEKVSCKNKHNNCLLWAVHGECFGKNTDFMELMCAPVCEKCKKKSYNDIYKLVERYGVPQKGLFKDDYTVYGNVARDKLVQLALDMDEYMKGRLVGADSDNSMCRNQLDNCILWAELGECENNSDYMKYYCAPSCHTCD